MLPRPNYCCWPLTAFEPPAKCQGSVAPCEAAATPSSLSSVSTTVRISQFCGSDAASVKRETTIANITVARMRTHTVEDSQPLASPPPPLPLLLTSYHLCSSPCTCVAAPCPKHDSVKCRKLECVTTAISRSGRVSSHLRQTSSRTGARRSQAFEPRTERAAQASTPLLHCALSCPLRVCCCALGATYLRKARPRRRMASLLSRTSAVHSTSSSGLTSEKSMPGNLGGGRWGRGHVVRGLSSASGGARDDAKGRRWAQNLDQEIGAHQT